jgi:hypothetical protein
MARLQSLRDEGLGTEHKMRLDPYDAGSILFSYDQGSALKQALEKVRLWRASRWRRRLGERLKQRSRRWLFGGCEERKRGASLGY